MSKNLTLYTGEILKRWDGTAPFLQPYLHFSAAADDELYYDTKYNIYYIYNNRPQIWCVADRLIAHLVTLRRILGDNY